MDATEIVLPGVGEPEALQVRTRALAPLRPGEARVRVEASGVSFAEQQMRRGIYYDQPRFPFVPGYDLVGVVEEVTAGTDPGLAVGQRVAALTKTGGWADRVVLPAADLVPVPDGVSAVEAETVVVNGVTAYRMLHRHTRARRGDTVVVLAAAGGVGSILVQLALHAGMRVIGTAGASQQDRLRELGVTPIDYRSEDVPARVRELAPGGVVAVFDPVAGPGLRDSWRMLAPGGRLVVFGTASDLDKPGSNFVPTLKVVARLAWWSVLPNRRGAHFFNLWAGVRNRARFRAALRTDLTAVLGLLRDGAVTAPVDSEYPLREAAAALRRAEAGGLSGKVILVP